MNEITVEKVDSKLVEAEYVNEKSVSVSGRYWSSMDVKRLLCMEGKTITEILDYAVCRYFLDTTNKQPTEFQKKLWFERCRVRIDGVEISPELWGETKPVAGAFVEFFVAPGKGGGGKNVLSMVLMVAVIAAAVITQQWAATALAGKVLFANTAGMATADAVASGIVIGSTTASTIGAVAGMAVMTIGTWAVGKICPTTASPQAQQSTQAASTSQTYSVTGSQNGMNPMGYVPLVLGKYRFSGPLAAKSWTQQVGDDQYFHMCVVWGHPNMSVTDFRIGDTPLYQYQNVTHVFHGSTTGNDLQYFNRSFNESSVGAALKYNTPITRVIGECDSISIDLYYPAFSDVTTGTPAGLSTQFILEYAHVNQNDWRRVSTKDSFFAWEQYVDTYTGADYGDLWCSRDGVWGTWLNNTHEQGHKEGIQATASGWNVNPIKEYKDKHKHHEWWTREAWWSSTEQGLITTTGNTTSPKTFNYEWAVPHGEWQVRITRVTPERSSNTVYDDCTWSTQRGIINKPAFNTPIPICVSELRIRASEQLSGYVSNFNALCHSIFPVWNSTTKTWTDDNYDYTQNPAAILRYLMTSRHALNSPYTTAKIDNQKLGEFYEWCAKKDYHFDFVCDSEAAAWNRWISVASAGRGAITTDNDGLFGVMIDNDDKIAVQMFTPRNSWGFSIERSFYTLPHALRVTFNDETDDYNSKEGFVYADGYNKSNATDIVEWNVTGKTRWSDVYKMGRYYLASIKLRPITITLSTDWEWLMCRRGDVVAVSHDVLMNTFGTARVVALIYKDTDTNEYIYIADEANKPTDGTQPVGVMLDDTVLFSQDKQFGIAIRNTNGKVITYGIVSELNKETNEMIFTNAITAAQCPYIGALASVSIFGQETANYLVASIAMSGNDNSAELTLVPWAMPDILEAESGTIPDWDPPIVLPQIGGAHNLPAPSIRDIKSDETMLKRSGNSLVVCMGIWWNLPQKIGSDTGRLSVQAKILKQGSTPDTTNEPIYAIADSTTAAFVLYEGVEEKATYRVWIRLVSEFGIVSPWSSFVDHTVVGRTTLPATPEGLIVSLNSPVGVKSKWQPNTELDVNQYKVVYSGEGLDDIEVLTPNTEANIAVTKWVGKLNVSVYAVDELKLLSAEPVKGSIMLYKPDTPVITSSLLSNTFILQWQDCATTWPIKYYVVHDKWVGHDTTFNAADEWTSIAARPTNADYDFDIYAHDIFDNIGDIGTVKVHIPDIVAPDVFNLSLDKEQLVMKWSGAVSAFDINYYELVDVEYKPVAHVKGTTYKMLVTGKGTKEYRVRVVDVAGNVSAWVEGSIEITAPDSPPDMEAYIVDSQVRVSWGDPYAASTDATKLPIVSYQLIRQWDKEIEPGLVETLEEDYGTYDALDAYVAPLKYGNHTFMVRAIDSGGNIGGWASVDISIRNPGKVTFYNCAAIDNNTMLYWTAPEPTSFPIAYYILYDVDEDGYESERGRVDGLFSAQIEHTSGSYVYRVKAADVADNIGEPSDITIVVSQPPDFIFYHDYDSLFNGEKTNIILSRDGYMLGPVVEGETWTENIDRTVTKINDSTVTADNLTWDIKSNKGHKYYPSPFTEETSTYIETLDVGTPVPSSRIQITITKKALEGNPVITCKIETSADNETWINLSDNATTVFGTSFQYIRVTLNWSGGLLEIDNINFTLDVKRKRDNGVAMLYKKDCYAADGVTLLPEDEIGTFVPFNDTFIDIEGDIAVAPVSEDTGYNPIVVFKDVPYPTGFKGIMLDKHGVPIDGEITWSVRGV